MARMKGFISTLGPECGRFAGGVGADTPHALSERFLHRRSEIIAFAELLGVGRFMGAQVDRSQEIYIPILGEAAADLQWPIDSIAPW